MKKIFFVYDDIIFVPGQIQKIVGEKQFGEIVYKRNKLYAHCCDELDRNRVCDTLFRLRSESDRAKLIDLIVNDGDGIVYFHMFASSVVTNADNFSILLEKSQYAIDTMVVNPINPVAVVFPSKACYRRYLESKTIKTADMGPGLDEADALLPSEGLIDISSYGNFLSFFSGGFEARHFNNITSELDTITKSSTDKLKMKAEYTLYSLLPETMKQFFVIPFNYKESGERASYTMERLLIPDMALQWINGSMSMCEFDVFLKKVFSFIACRLTRETGDGELDRIWRETYIEKVDTRIRRLKQMPSFQIIADYLRISTEEKSLDSIFRKYCVLYSSLTKKKRRDRTLAVGHGDLCFSNMLYQKDINLLRLIDPRGALNEYEIWMDPYYDIAKLSHSICGNYDYVNNGMFSLTLDNDCLLRMDLDVESGSQYVQAFKDALDASGYDYALVRLFEASLFISMLPLHIDDTRKVLAFILIATSILKELESYA
jgi:hypothetical protein